MSVPESIAWLETSRNSKSPSAAKVYATTILDELQRIYTALDTTIRECESQERLRMETLRNHRDLESSFAGLEEKTTRAREEWDRDRAELEGRVAKVTERLRTAETMLKDAHYALLNQPELTREEIAASITSVVTPYPKGEKP